MNKLLFILPDGNADGMTALAFCHELCEFLDHEEFEAYWDEDAYKLLRGSVGGSDRTSSGLRRLRFQKFTDYRYLNALPPEIKVFVSENDCSEGIYGRFAAVRIDGGSTALVKSPGAMLPESLALWRNYIPQAPVPTKPSIDSCRSACTWFAANRRPERRFNFKAPKHGKEEYEKEGLKVSPLTLPESEIEKALHLAVGTGKQGRLLYTDTSMQVVLVFSYETTDNATGSPVYHGHQLSADDKKQLRRLTPELLKKLEKIS